jgi:hypothetical protein
MELQEDHRMCGQPPEICVIRTINNNLEWALFVFDGNFFYAAQTIGSWKTVYQSTKEVIAIARQCQMTVEWKDYPIAMYYGIKDDADIIMAILANGS